MFHRDEILRFLQKPVLLASSPITTLAFILGLQAANTRFSRHHNDAASRVS
jgi:hypothetical protein